MPLDTQTKKLLDSLVCALIALDPQEKILFLNLSATKLFGYEREALIGQPIEHVVDQKAHQGIHKNGRRIPIKTKATQLCGEESAVTLLSICDLSIHNLDRCVPLHFIENFPLAMLMTDEEGVMIRANAPLCAIFGYEPHELEGEKVEILLPHHLRKRHVSLREEYIDATPKPRMMGTGRNLEGRHKDGSLIPVEIGLNPVVLGEKRYVIASLLDLSVKKEQERHLEYLVADLERANRELEKFIYATVSNLQAPLRRIESFSHLVQNEHAKEISAEAHTSLMRIDNETKHAMELLGDLLALSRIFTEGEPLSQVDLNATLAQVIGDLSEKVDAVEGKVKVETLEAVKGDEAQLYQLFYHLIDNALKFHRKEVPPCIQIWGETKGSLYCIHIRDNGIGIPSGEEKHIFEPFYRIDTDEPYSGVGFGLALCQKIVERHHGTLSLTDHGEQGACFTVELQRS